MCRAEIASITVAPGISHDAPARASAQDTSGTATAIQRTTWPHPDARRRATTMPASVAATRKMSSAAECGNNSDTAAR